MAMDDLIMFCNTEYTVYYNTGNRNYTEDIVTGDKHV